MKKLIIGLLSFGYTNFASADYRTEVKPNPLVCHGENRANKEEKISLKLQYIEQQGKLGTDVEVQVGTEAPLKIESAPAMHAENEGITNLMLIFTKDNHKFNLGLGGAIYDHFSKSQDETKEYSTRGSLRLDGKDFWFDHCTIRFAKSSQQSDFGNELGESSQLFER